MTIQIDRRSLLKLSTLGLAGMSIPAAAQVLSARGFTHNVASGEPSANSVLLWTRYVPAGRSSGRLRWQVSDSESFGRIVASGQVTADGERDHIVKPVARGLEPGRWYFYRFTDAAGRHSPVGRTRTLPEGPTASFRLGVFSCSNLPFGFFNAYGHAAARRDIDLMVHLGDYLYEYERGQYPDAAEAVAGRVIEPATEMIRLADYRLRFASYRLDPDLQELHRMFPVVAMWDDHETANDSWNGGAGNHQPATEGPWPARKAASMRAYHEWMPVSDDTWTSYEIGDLATLFRPETRLTGRTQQLNLGAVLRGHAPAEFGAVMTAFRDGPWRDPARTLMGAEQEAWLAQGLRASVGAGKKWQVLGQQVVMGTLSVPPALAQAAMALNLPEQSRNYLIAGAAAGAAGVPFNMDAWDGYPAARERLLRASLDAGANLVVLSGDSHNAWAFDLDMGGTAAGVEFAGTSVTSPGYEDSLPGIPPAMLQQAVVASNRQLKWCDTSRRGYLTVEMTPDRVTGEFVFMNTVRQRDRGLSGTNSFTAAHGARRMTMA